MSQRCVEVTDISLNESLDRPAIEDLRAVRKGWLSAHWVNYQLAGDEVGRHALVFATVKRLDDQSEQLPLYVLSEEERAVLIGAPLVREALRSAETVQYDCGLTQEGADWLIEQYENAAA